MGSGSSNSYSGTSGSSQPYSAEYKVVPQMMSKDKADPDIYDPKTGYFRNPTAVKLEASVSGNNIDFEGNHANGDFTYVMNANGEIVFGKRCNPNDGRKRSPHPTLIGGKDPKVQCAGIINFRNGKIYSVDNNSGHYRPNIKSLDKVNKALQKMCDDNPRLFDRRSEWRKK